MGYHITCEAMPGIVFKARAESVENAVKKLMTEMRAAMAERQAPKENPKDEARRGFPA